MKKRIALAIATSTVISLGVLMAWPIPLGVPGEWTWQRHRFFTDLADAFDRLLPAVIAAAVFALIAVYRAPKPNRSGKLKSVLSYSLLLVAAWFWLNAVQQSATIEHRETKPYWVLYDPSSSGYFFEAAFRIPDTAEFLRGYADRMREGEVLHVGTHPPGLFLLSKACLSVCEQSPTLVSVLNGFEHDSVRNAFRHLETEARYAPGLKSSEVAALHLLSGLSHLAVILTILPLALLCRFLFGPQVAWKLCCLWPTLPCLAVFLPKSDLLFPLTCTSSLMLMVLAMSGGKRMLLAIPAGGILWLGLMMSLAHLPVGVFLIVFALLRAVQSRGDNVKGDVMVGGLMLFTIVACCLVWNALTDCNIFTVWRLNLSNHARFYDQFERSWQKWLLVNPVELLVSVGAPVFILAVSGVATAAKELRTRDTSVTSNRVSTAFCLAGAATVILLWLSGKNQGEAARLWCFLTPWVVVTAGALLHSDRFPLGQKQWTWLIVAQLVVSLGTVSRVSGFSF